MEVNAVMNVFVEKVPEGATGCQSSYRETSVAPGLVPGSDWWRQEVRVRGVEATEGGREGVWQRSGGGALVGE